MSNNKQSIKIYTEEQVKMMLDKMSLVTERKNLGVSSNFRHRAIEIDNLIQLQTPIELPSDEEIEREARDENIYNNLQFRKGAKMVINKIQGGNK